jgi:CheY-like chemotaxis protein
MSVSILVVDDEPDVAELFRQRFRRETRQGIYVLHYAASAAEALDRLAGEIEPAPLDRQRLGLCETRTVRWREPDSNLRSLFRINTYAERDNRDCLVSYMLVKPLHCSSTLRA